MGVRLQGMNLVKWLVVRCCWTLLVLSGCFIDSAAYAHISPVDGTDAAAGVGDSIPAVSNGNSSSPKDSVFSETQQTWLDGHPPIRIGVTGIPPQVFRDEQTGQLSGLCIDYIRRIETLLGTSFEIIYYQTWDDMMEAAYAHQIDVIYAAQKTPSRLEAFLFTRPYLEFSNKIVMTTQVKGPVTMPELAGRRVTVVHGAAIEEYLKINYPQIVQIPVSDELVGLLRVSFGQADAMIIEVSRASWYIQQDKITNLHIVGDAGYRYLLGFACRKDEPRIRDILDAALMQISPEQRRRLEARWVFPTESREIDWRIVTGVLVGVAGLLVWILFWNMLLRRSVKARTFELQLELTERKKAEASLFESRRRISTLMDNLQGVAFRCLNRPDWPMDVISKGCLELTGYTVEEFLSRQIVWNNLIVPEDQTPVWENVQEALAKHQTYQIEYRIRTRDGQLKWLWEKGSGEWDKDGNVTVLEGFVADISRRKEMEEKLRRREEELASILKASPVGIGRTINRVFLHVNDRVCDMTGYTSEELVGQSSRMLYPTQEEYDAVGQEKYRQIKETGIGSVETHWLCKNGETIDVLLSSAPIDAADLSKGVIFSALDITEQKKAEQMLQFTQFAVDHAGEAAFWMDASGRMIYVNEAACRSLGYTRDELMQMTIPDIDPNFPAENWGQHWEESRGKGSFRLETQHRTKDGRLIPVEISVNYVCYEGVEYHCSFVRDISERKAAEAARQKLVDELQSKNEELESIVFIASHDLRSPLVNIRGFTGELQKSLSQLQQLLADEAVNESTRKKLDRLFHEDIAESIGFIDAGNRKMDILLNGLLRLSRVGTTQVSLTDLDMNHMFEGIINNFHFRTRQMDIEITVDPDVPTCLGDVVLINQVFNNLIENAIKYRSPDRPARIHISAEAKNGTVVYCVRDNGIGINPAHVDKVFEIFHRLNPAGDETGEGLGLTIVRRLLKRQGGRVWIESQPDVGTSVYVELPRI